jgi:hypothetical protein
MITSDKTAAELLAEIGSSLYGDDAWRGRLADALNIRRDTMRHILSGKSRLPPDHGLWRDLAALLEEREVDVRAARLALAQWLKINTEKEKQT